MKAPDYGYKKKEKEEKKKKKSSACAKKKSKENAHKSLWEKKNFGEQDDKISLTYSVLCLRRRLLILKILGMNLVELISRTHYENRKRDEIDYWIKVKTLPIFESFFELYNFAIFEAIFHVLFKVFHSFDLI